MKEYGNWTGVFTWKAEWRKPTADCVPLELYEATKANHRLTREKVPNLPDWTDDLILFSRDEERGLVTIGWYCAVDAGSAPTPQGRGASTVQVRPAGAPPGSTADLS